jgi:hypothetical protein
MENNYQYFSKWRLIWISTYLNEGQVIQMKKYKYLIREIGGIEKIDFQDELILKNNDQESENENWYNQIITFKLIDKKV